MGTETGSSCNGMMTASDGMRLSETAGAYMRLQEIGGDGV